MLCCYWRRKVAHNSLRRIRETIAFVCILNQVCLRDFNVKEMNNQAVNSNKLNICKKFYLKCCFLFSSCCTFWSHPRALTGEKSPCNPWRKQSQKAFPALLFALLFCFYLYNDLFIWCIQTWKENLLWPAWEMHLSVSGSGSPEHCLVFFFFLWVTVSPAYKTVQIR